jgi:hypothetical protein
MVSEWGRVRPQPCGVDCWRPESAHHSTPPPPCSPNPRTRTLAHTPSHTHTQAGGPKHTSEVVDAGAILCEREKSSVGDSVVEVEVPPFPVPRPAVLEPAPPGAVRPPHIPSFFPALPEPFTYQATPSHAEVRGEAASKRHHTQLVREVRRRVGGGAAGARLRVPHARGALCPGACVCEARQGCALRAAGTGLCCCFPLSLAIVCPARACPPHLCLMCMHALSAGPRRLCPH